MLRVASLRYDVIFKKAFCDVEVFKAFVFDMLGVRLEIDRVETEKTFHPPLGYIKPRFDLFAQDLKNRVIVDIQHSHFRDHYDRFLYYHCVAMLEQVKHSSNYRPPLTVYTIAVLTDGGSPDEAPVAVIDLDPVDVENQQKLGKIKHRVVYLAPHRIRETTPEQYREWLLAIKDSLDGQVDEAAYQKAAIHRAFAHIEEDLLTPEDRAQMIEEYNITEKVQDARTEGVKQGLRQGLTEGVRQGAQETARRMLAKGMDAFTVAELTGLSEDDVQALTKTLLET